MLILGLFALVLVSGVRIASSVNDPFASMLAFGATFSLVFQAILNMAVASSLMPTTGIALPFVSYGGSSLVVSGAMAGLVLRVGGERSFSSGPERTRPAVQPELVG